MSKKQNLINGYLQSLSPVHDEVAPEVNENYQDIMEIDEKMKIPEEFKPGNNAPIEIPKTAIVTKDMIITGSLDAESNIAVYGTVKGDITTSAEVMVAGVVEGNLVAKSVRLQSYTLKGNIKAGGNVEITEGELEGNIEAVNIQVDCHVLGNIQAQFIELREHAVIEGDLVAASIQMAKGAVLNGKVTIGGNS